MARGKKKDRSNFVMLGRDLLTSKEWRQDLSLSAHELYWQIKRKYNGSNNGEIRLYYSELSNFLAPGTIAKGFKELEDNGWIVRIKIGTGKHRWIYDIKLTGKYDRLIF